MFKFLSATVCILGLISVSKSYASSEAHIPLTGDALGKQKQEVPVTQLQSHHPDVYRALIASPEGYNAVHGINNNNNNVVPEQPEKEDPDLIALRAFLNTHPNLRAQLIKDEEKHEAQRRELHKAEMRIHDLNMKHIEEVHQLKIELGQVSREKAELEAIMKITATASQKEQEIAREKWRALENRASELASKVWDLERDKLELNKKLVTLEATKRDDDRVLAQLSSELDVAQRRMNLMNQLLELTKKQQEELTEFYKSLSTTYSADVTIQALIKGYVDQLVDLKQALVASQAESKRLELELEAKTREAAINKE